MEATPNTARHIVEIARRTEDGNWIFVDSIRDDITADTDLEHILDELLADVTEDSDWCVSLIELDDDGDELRRIAQMERTIGAGASPQ